MSDDELLVQQVQAVLDANDPSDGIDRHDGYGRDYRLTDLRLVRSDDGFDDLEVTVRHADGVQVRRMLFDRAWRESSGLEDAVSCAAYVAARWMVSRSGQVSDPRPLRQATAGTDELWRALEDALARGYAGVNRVGHGRLEVVEEVGEIVTIHVTPQQWRRYVDDCEGTAEQDFGEDAWRAGDGLVIALDSLDELLGSRWDDEEHVVLFRGDLHASVRPELPPVRSMLLRETSDADGDWYATGPGGD